MSDRPVSSPNRAGKPVLGRPAPLEPVVGWEDELDVPLEPELELDVDPEPEPLDEDPADPLLEPVLDPPPEATTVIVPFMNGCTLQK